MAENTKPAAEIDFERHPSSYLHWKFQVDGDVARLTMDVK